MGYNKSKKSVTKSLTQLDQLEQAKRTIKFPTNDPAALQRRLHEAVAAAEMHEEFRHYFDSIKNYYRFEQEDGYLVARYVVNQLVIGDPEELMGNGNGKGHISPQIDKSREITIDNAFSLIDVLGSVLGNLDAMEITFPLVVLTYNEKLKLWAWTKESDHTEWVFIDMMDKGIVLTRKDGIPIEMLWSPEQRDELEDDSIL